MPRRALLLSLALVAVLLFPGAAGSAPPPGGDARAGDAWRSVVAEARTTCGVKKDHTAWGRWSTVGSRGDLMTVGVRTDGSGWTWGYNSHGQVGNATTKDRLTPYRLR